MHPWVDRCMHTYIHTCGYMHCKLTLIWTFWGFFYSLLKANQMGLVKKTSPQWAMPATVAYADSPTKEEPRRGLCNRKLTTLLQICGVTLQGALPISLSLCVCGSLESYMPIAHVRFWIWWSHAFCFPFSFAWYLSLEMQTHVHHFWRIKGFLCQLLLFHFYFNFFPCLACSSFSIFCFGRFSLLRCVIR